MVSLEPFEIAMICLACCVCAALCCYCARRRSSVLDSALLSLSRACANTGSDVLLLFNPGTLGAWCFSLYPGRSLSRLCCCCCIMAGNTHTRTQKTASHSRKAVPKCAIFNRVISSISGAPTRSGSSSFYFFPVSVCCYIDVLSGMIKTPSPTRILALASNALYRGFY